MLRVDFYVRQRATTLPVTLPCASPRTPAAYLVQSNSYGIMERKVYGLCDTIDANRGHHERLATEILRR
jgi:hypothetical protein